MERVVTAQEMKWCDEATIKDVGIPGLLLMENAGGSVARNVNDILGNLNGKHLVICCGKGNNGGDGYVVARHLAHAGARITVVLMTSPLEFKGDALTNFTILKKISGRTLPPVSILRYSRTLLDNLHSFDGIVDAVFGTGFSGRMKRPSSDLIDWINRQNVPVFAVDIPSGLNATNGTVEQVAVRASHTITLGLLKTGLLLNKGKEFAGKVCVADIGIPRIVTESKTLARTYLVTAGDVRSMLPRRPITAHKYSVGKVLVVAGSKGLTGAAAMCASAALRSGAGAVLLATPESVYPVLSRKLTEIMVMPLPSTDAGTLAKKGFEALLPKLHWADVVAIGPGLSQHPETREVILRILKEYDGRILLDADGLNAVALSGIELLKKSKARVILTPHTGELGRLVKRDSADVDLERIDLPRSFARRVSKTVILKGAPTVTAIANGSVYVNSTGNPGMATVGSGDVLSGIIAGLWSQGASEEEAAYGGVYLHGLAGDCAAKEYGERSLVAGDMIQFLPKAFASVELKESA